MLGIGSYLWSDGTESPPGWYPPAGSVSIDLSSFAQIAAATPGQPRGVALFQFQPTDDTKEFLNAGGVLLSSDDARDGTPDGKGLDAIESMLGYRPRGDRWSDCLWDILTAGADPANLDGPGILVPTVGRKLELWFANSLYRSDDFDFATDPLTPKLKALLQSQLNAARNLALDGQMISPVTKQPDLEYHLRIADAIVEKYVGRNPAAKADLFAELKPIEWDAAEQPKPHATTISDDFNRTNSTGLGTAAGGWSWSNTINNGFNIVSNRAQSGSSLQSKAARAESDLSSSDHECSCDITTVLSNRDVGPACRHDSSAAEFYGVKIFSGGGWIVQKYISSALTNIFSGTSSWSSGDSLKLSCNGSTLEAFLRGSSLGSQTDTSLAGNTRCGLYSTSGNANTAADNWLAGDLASGGGVPSLLLQRKRTGMVMGTKSVLAKM